MYPSVLFDGEPRELSGVPLAAMPALLHGAGLFETIRVDDGEPCFLHRHLARLWATLGQVPRVAAPPPALLEEKLLREGLRALVAMGSIPAAVALRIVVADAHVLCTFRPLPGEAPVSIERLVPAYVRGDLWPQRKTLSYLRNLAFLDEGVLFTNDTGELCEAPAANVFALVDGRLRTPPIATPCLPGIARAVLLEAGSLAGFPIEEAALGAADIPRIEACFLTNALRRAVPVRAIVGRPCPGSDALADEARRILVDAARRDGTNDGAR